MVAKPGTQQSQGSGQARHIGGTVWYNIVGWVRQESAATTALVQAFIALGIAFEWWHWSPAQTGAVVGIVAALLGMFVRSQVTPIHRFRPRTAEPGASGRAVSNGPQGEMDNGVRVLPGTDAGPDAGMAGGPRPGPAGVMAGGPPAGPDARQAPGPYPGPPGPQPGRPDIGQAPGPYPGPPGPQHPRPDAGPPTRPDVPPGFPEPGQRQ